jgi:hypothetical protein
MPAKARTRDGCDDRPRPCRRRCRYRLPRGLCALELAGERPRDIDEIAELLGATRGAVRKAICDALNKLRRASKRGEEDHDGR